MKQKLNYTKRENLKFYRLLYTTTGEKIEINMVICFRLVKNQAELADGPIQYVRRQGRGTWFVMRQSAKASGPGTSDSLLSFRWKISAAKSR